jgi:Protein of unknown function (DUF3108)
MFLKPLLVVLICAPLALPQSLPNKESPQSLPSKETLYYSIDWRLFTSGKAKLEFAALPASRPGYQVNLHLESAGFVSKLFKVDYDYASILSAALCAQSAQMTAHEGSRQRETKITFDEEARKASYLERDQVKNTVVLQQEIDIPQCVHDMAGGLFFVRTLNLEPGQSIQVPVSDGKKSAMAKVEAQQREDVKTPAGTFKTIRYELYLFNGVLYKRPARLNVWLTDDRRKLPVQIRVRMQFTIGTINLVLEKHE